MIFAGSGSAPDHVEMSFGDRDFHVGLAELLLGWLLELGIAMAATLVEFEAVFGPDPAGARDQWTKTAEVLLASSGRCAVTVTDVDGERRYLVMNWRREPRSAAKRLLL